jgi:dynamin 1-like protein
MNHIRDCLPELKRRVSSMIAQCQSLLQTLGEPIADKPRAMLQIITNFSNAYTSALDGSSKRVQTDEL